MVSSPAQQKEVRGISRIGDAACRARGPTPGIRTPAKQYPRSMPETPATPVDIKPRSRTVTDGIEATTSRGMLRAVGMGDADWDKPQIGIAS